MASSKRRGFFRAAGLVLLSLILLVATLPVWFPWVLRPLAKRVGASYRQYDREGYQRFRLTGFALTNQSGRLDAKQVDAYLPTVWLWRCLVGPKTAPFLSVDSWSWRASPASSSQRAPSALKDLHEVQSKVPTYEKWLPMAELKGGNVYLKDRTVEIPRAIWAGGKLSAQLAIPNFEKEPVHLFLAIMQSAPLKLTLDLNAPALDLHSRFTIAAAARGVDIHGTGLWSSNRIELSANLFRHGFIPNTATVRANSFVIPARLLKLKDYKNLIGSLDANWETNWFNLNVTALANPSSGDWPPVRIVTKASGSTHAAQIDLARVTSPWLDAELLRPTKILFKPPFLSQPATLKMTANVSKEPWFPANGTLQGRAVLQPSTNRYPRISFVFTGTGLSISNVEAKTFQLKGRLNWPRASLTRADVELADGSKLFLVGGFDFQSKRVHDGRLRYSGGFFRRYLPAQFSFDTASLDARFAGSLSNLTNSGTLNVENLRVPRAKPLHLDANWRGNGLDLHQIQLALKSGNSSLRLRGSARLGASRKTVELNAFELNQNNRSELRLQYPVEVAFQRMSAAKSWTFAVQPTVLSSEHARLQLAATTVWPARGMFQLQAHHLESSLLRDFLQTPPPDVELNDLNFVGDWTNGPIAFHLNSDAKWKTAGRYSLGINIQADSCTNGISIQRVSISSGTQTVCQAEGLFPVALEPGATNSFLHINEDGPLWLHAAAQTNSIVWQEIAKASGLLLIQPQLQADVNGTMARPEGRISLQAQRIRFPRVQHLLPSLENFDFTAEFGHGEARVSQFHFLLQGQPVEFTGQIPLRKHFWAAMVSKRKLPNWREANARLKIENAQLAPFTFLEPGILGPQGVLQADIVLEPGGVLNGELTITNAATLPLPSLGAVQDINLTVVFAGQTAELTNFSAAIGGEPVVATGQMPLDALSRPGLPPFEIHLRGADVPLLRKPNLILRADLNLDLTNSSADQGIISGRVTLLNSLFLASLQSLVPENTTSPEQHPPYFSVSAQPWAAWRLDIQVRGDQFMRVQTPVFRGTVSAAMKLENTLANPLVIGEVQIASGTVTFPFGSLNVSQGFITLTSDNPFHPLLFVAAKTQQFGYNIKLEVTGTAENPFVQFSSTPPMSSQEIVMMLTTGQLPAGIGVTTTALQRAQGVAMFFGRNLLSEFGLGLGEQNRLTFRSGQEISLSGRPTYEVKYKISKRWSIIAEYDRFDQYDLNLQWNIFSK